MNNLRTGRFYPSCTIGFYSTTFLSSVLIHILSPHALHRTLDWIGFQSLSCWRWYTVWTVRTLTGIGMCRHPSYHCGKPMDGRYVGQSEWSTVLLYMDDVSAERLSNGSRKLESCGSESQSSCGDYVFAIQTDDPERGSEPLTIESKHDVMRWWWYLIGSTGSFVTMKVRLDIQWKPSKSWPFSHIPLQDPYLPVLDKAKRREMMLENF